MQRKVMIGKVMIGIILLIWSLFVFVIGMAIGTRQAYNHEVAGPDKIYENFKIRDVEVHLEDGKTFYLTERKE